MRWYIQAVRLQLLQVLPRLPSKDQRHPPQFSALEILGRLFLSPWLRRPAHTGEVGNVWSFNFFFYNRKLKRILYFACRGRSRAAANSSANEQQSTGAYNSDEEVSHRDVTATNKLWGATA